MVASAHDVGMALGTCWRPHAGSVSHHLSFFSLLSSPPRPTSWSVSPFLRLSAAPLLLLSRDSRRERRSDGPSRKGKDNAVGLISRLLSDWQLCSVRCAVVSVARIWSAPLINRSRKFCSSVEWVGEANRYQPIIRSCLLDFYFEFPYSLTAEGSCKIILCL